MIIILGIIISYLIGSIPTAYIFGKIYKGIDIRQHGSGNVGATNVFRVLGKNPGIIVLILDILKGVLAVTLAAEILGINSVIHRILMALSVVGGHNWTIFLNFKGGKGIATSLGVLIGLAIKIASIRHVLLITVIIWLVTFFISGIVSLSSMIAATLLPIIMVWTNQSIEIVCLGIIICVFVILRHRANIKRLLSRTEPRVSLPFRFRKISKNFFYLILMGSFLFGCATIHNDISSLKEIEKNVTKPDFTPQQNSTEFQNIKEEELEEYVEKKGVVFAKTNFHGVLDTHYVRLLIDSKEDITHKFQLHIGDTIKQKPLIWDEKGDVKAVKPGYFFIELPIGEYRISSVLIPVGTTVAEENIDITFEVIQDTIVYIGTLKIIGTKEKIKLGGVPVIKPGFEYNVEIFDETQEGIQAFQKNYPGVEAKILTKLMKNNNVEN